MKTFGFRTGSFALVAAAVAFSLASVDAVAGGRGGNYQPADVGCDYAACDMMVHTVYVPTLVKERRVINVTECRTEQRERQVTVNKCVPETRSVREIYTVMVPEVHHRTESYYVCRPVVREVNRNVTVQVPSYEQRQGTRQVCRQVKVQEMCNVTRDHGHWEEVICEGECGGYNPCVASCCRPIRRRARGCGGCNSCRSCDSCGNDWSCGGDNGCGKAVAAHTHQVWRPNLVTEQVPVTVWRTEMVAEPYQYTVTTWHSENRVQVVHVCDTVKEEHQRDVAFTVCVPQQRERVRTLTTYTTVAEQRIERYMVVVPHTVQREVEVTVCRMVPQQVVCPAPVCGPRCGPHRGGW